VALGILGFSSELKGTEEAEFMGIMSCMQREIVARTRGGAEEKVAKSLRARRSRAVGVVFPFSSKLASKWRLKQGAQIFLLNPMPFVLPASIKCVKFEPNNVVYVKMEVIDRVLIVQIHSQDLLVRCKPDQLMLSVSV
jgi:hypothetical protein